jgi:hypothetical protein
MKNNIIFLTFVLLVSSCSQLHNDVTIAEVNKIEKNIDLRVSDNIN